MHRSLTVDFHEMGFGARLAGENTQGFWFQMSRQQRQHATPPWGPGNPQELNRYSYVNNNPLKYSDPSGHITIVYEGVESYNKLRDARRAIESAIREIKKAQAATSTFKDYLGAFVSDLCAVATKGACPTGFASELVKSLADLVDQDWEALLAGLEFISQRLDDLHDYWLEYASTSQQQPFGMGMDLFFWDAPGLGGQGFIIAQYFVTDGNVRYVFNTYGDVFSDVFKDMLGSIDRSVPKDFN